MNTINVGFQAVVNRDRVLAILPATSSLPTKRLRNRAKENDKLIDVASGRKKRSLIILDTGHIVLSGVSAETLGARMEY